MTTGVVVMAYGTPSRRDEIAAYYTDVRRGRPPTAEQLADLEARYDAIGGLSPLTTVSRQQVAGVAAALERLAPGHYRVAYGTKHATPRIEEAAKELAATGVDALVGVVLAPHYSTLGVGEYLDRLHEEGTALGLPVGNVERFGADGRFISLLAERVEVAQRRIASPLERTEVLFSAHSLPERILAVGDAYAAELAETAALVASVADLTRFRSVWQSASRTPEPWLGPDISDVMSELADNSTTGVIVCPAGFTSDHLEVLYDLDIVARRRAEELGLAFQRTASLNADPVLMEVLAELILGADPAAS